MSSNFWSLIKKTFTEWKQDNAALFSAALSYYAIFAIAPIIILVVFIAGLVIGNNQALQNQIYSQISQTIGPNAAGMIQQMVNARLNQTSGGIIATILGVVALLVGATGVFAQLQSSLNKIWEVEPKPNTGIKELIMGRLTDFLLILGLGILLLVAFAAGAVVTSLGTFFSGVLPGGTWIWQIVNFIISGAIVALVIALIFKYLPDVKIDWKDVWVGAVVTAVLFEIGNFLIGLYLGHSAVTSAYGAAGSLVILLVWIYYSAQILFMGAEFTQVYARRHGEIIEPEENFQKMPFSKKATASSTRPAAEHTPAVTSNRVAENMMPIPITSQPQLHAEPYSTVREEKVRYQAPNPASVVPVLALGTLASFATIARIVSIFSGGSKE